MAMQLQNYIQGDPLPNNVAKGTAENFKKLTILLQAHCCNAITFLLHLVCCKHVSNFINRHTCTAVSHLSGPQEGICTNKELDQGLEIVSRVHYHWAITAGLFWTGKTVC